jgi:hypothetical protein
MQTAERRRRHRSRALPIALAVAGLLTGCSPARTLESVDVLRDIQAASGPSELKKETVRPTRDQIVYTVAGRRREADLYRPNFQPLKADLVLVPGLTPQGRNDPRVVVFATTLARAGFRVLVPDLPDLRHFQVSGTDTITVADAVCFLQAEPTGRPLGVGAVSFAVGPAVGALFEPEAEGRVDFFLSVGGYHDLTALITYVTTGYYRRSPDAPWQYREPKRYGRWVFLLTNAARLDDPHDKLALMQMAERKLSNPDADIDDLVAQLGPDGRAVYAVLTNTDPDRVQALMDALPPSVMREANALDLKQRNIASLDTWFILVHDRNDRIIPADQSLIFADNANPGHAEAFLVKGLDHAEPKEVSVFDLTELVRAVYAVLQERDRDVAPRPPCPDVETIVPPSPQAVGAVS